MGRFVQRNRWRRGRWLVIDDESGFVEYSDKVVRRWDGMYVRKDQNEPPDPQWYISAPADPPPVPFVRPDEPDGPACKTILPYQTTGIWQFWISTMVIQQTFTVFPDARPPLSPFPGYNLYVGSSIGSMEIECSFIVFPDSTQLPPA